MKKIILFYFFLISIVQASAQCAMCKATVETNLQSDANTWNGPNLAIFYLLLIPYICAMVFWYLWRSHKKKTEEHNKKIGATLSKLEN